MAGPTGLEPATSGVTGRRSSRLNYDPVSVCVSAPPPDPGETRDLSAQLARTVLSDETTSLFSDSDKLGPTSIWGPR